VRGYSASRVFSVEEVRLYQRAVSLVEIVPDMPKLRCHELARAVGRILGLEHEDGVYGFVDHTWLWTTALDRQSPLVQETRIGFPNVLDVYSVGQLPMVRLVECGHASLPHMGWSYRPRRPRKDIDEGLVDRLVRIMLQEEP
jgi:hypothetical protein